MSRRVVLGLVALAGVAGAAIGALAVRHFRDDPPAQPTRRAVSIRIPADIDLLDIAVSADATRIAYTAIRDGRAHLYVRPLDRFETSVVAGSEGAMQPFFSPDGAALGFFADGFLKTVPLDADGAEPAVVCRVAGEPAGAAWGSGGTIVFGGPGRSGLLEVPAGGGEPAALTVIDEEEGETAHGWPHVIDNRRILHTVGRIGRDPRLVIFDRETGDTRPLLLADGGGFAVEPSTVVFARRGEIFATAVDLTADDPRYAPSQRPVLQGVATSGAGYRRLGRSRFAAARDGTLVFVPPPATGGDSRLVRVDRRGRSERLDEVVGQHHTPRLSPDGRRVAFAATTAILRRDIWLLDLPSGDRRQLTAEAGDNHSPLWSRDGATLTFASSRAGLQQLFRLRPRDPDTAGLLLGGDLRTPGSWSPDGDRLAFHEVHPDRDRDIWLWREDGDARDAAGEGGDGTDAGSPAPWLATAANERAPAFSPDGRWLAYVSDGEGDGDQVYVRAAGNGDAAGSDATGPPLRVSHAGGTEPVWAQSGATLFHRRGRGLYRVDITADDRGQPAAGAPEHLFDGTFLADPLGNLPAYDVDPDGDGFVMLEFASRAGVVHLLSGWRGWVFPPAPE